jgi:transcriptional regulator with PAS, ATPase and Fis domain
VPIVTKSGKYYGGVATIHDASRVEEMDRKIRISLHASGLTAKSTFNDIIGVSGPSQSTSATARKFANSDFTVLITGESGTGKELFAQSIVNASRRKKGPFLAVNCASIPSNLLEAELFGYEEGSFTGARKGGKVGYFELAHEGRSSWTRSGTSPRSSRQGSCASSRKKRSSASGAAGSFPWT